MFAFNMLTAIIGMTALIIILGFMTLKVLQDKKTVYSWVILLFLIFFLVLAVWQAVDFIQ